MGFKQSTSDPYIYLQHSRWSILAVYVDDIMLAGKSQQKIDEVKAALGRRFQLKDMSELHYFLGVSVKQNSETGKTWIGQPAYTKASSRNSEWTIRNLLVHQWLKEQNC